MHLTLGIRSPLSDTARPTRANRSRYSLRVTDIPTRSNKIERALLSEGAIYGLVLVAGMIVVSRNLAGSSWDALNTVLATVVVFYAAHVFADTLTGLTASDGHKRTFRESFRHAIRRSFGMLGVAVVPVVVLALGVTDVLDDADAVWLALYVDVALLGAVGWWITATRSPSFWVRAGGALLTGAFGGILILLKALIHH